MKTTTIYLHGSKDSNVEKGTEIGLTGNALMKFRHTLGEVAVTIFVDAEGVAYPTEFRCDGYSYRRVGGYPELETRIKEGA